MQISLWLVATLSFSLVPFKLDDWLAGYIWSDEVGNVLNWEYLELNLSELIVCWSILLVPFRASGRSVDCILCSLLLIKWKLLGTRSVWKSLNVTFGLAKWVIGSKSLDLIFGLAKWLMAMDRRLWLCVDEGPSTIYHLHVWDQTLGLLLFEDQGMYKLKAGINQSTCFNMMGSTCIGVSYSVSFCYYSVGMNEREG